MRTAPQRRQGAALFFFSVSIIAGVSLASGCSGSGNIAISPIPWVGPAISLESAQGQSVVVMRAPTSGWAFGLDRTRPAFDCTEVFVTATGPDPAVMQTQSIVRHEAGSTVATTMGVDVYARLLGHGEKPASQPYHLVLSAPGVPNPPPAKATTAKETKAPKAK